MKFFFFPSNLLILVLIIPINSANNNFSSYNSKTNSLFRNNFDNILVSKVFFQKNENLINNKEIKFTVSYLSTIKATKSQLFNLTKNRPCVHKTGVMHLLVSPPGKGNTTLKVKECYVSLSPESLFFFKSLNKDDLFSSIKVKDITRITQNYPGTNCFDLHSGHGTLGYSLKEVTLCYKTKEELNEWINAIIAFKKCYIMQINDIKNKHINLIHNNNENKRKLLNEIQYANPNSNNPINNKSNIIKKSMMKLLSSYKKGFVAEKRLKRIMRAKMRKELDKIKEDEKKEISVKTLMDRRLAKEKENEIKLIKLEHKQKEVTLINQAKDKMLKLRIKELKETENLYQNQILKKKQEAKKKAVSMLRMLRNQKKLSNWSVCVSQKLKGFANKEYVNKLCFKYYGEANSSKCKRKENFCDKCCHFHIGINHEKIRLKCNKKCRKILNNQNGKSTKSNAKKILPKRNKKVNKSKNKKNRPK